MMPCAVKALMSCLLVLLASASAADSSQEECASKAEDLPESHATTMLAVRHNFSSIARQKSIDDIRVLLFLNTHLSDGHLDFLRKCWPALMKNSALLQHADVLLFATGEPPQDIVHEVFRDKTVRVEQYPNKGYEGGAMAAMEVSTNQSWFSGYDWVIRLNPDVLILEDEWLIKNMLDDGVDGIFADCHDGTCVSGCTSVTHMNSDFFAARGKLMGPGSIPFERFDGAESQVTAMFRSTVQLGRDRWVPGTKQESICRIRGPGVPVLHAHSVVKMCPLAKGEPEDRDIYNGW